MTRIAAFATAVLAMAPAFAAGDGLEGAPWWMFVVLYGIPLAVVIFMAVSLGFVLHGLLRLRNALALLAIAGCALLTMLATIYGYEKVADSASLFAFSVAGLCPFVGLGWLLGMRDAARQASRKLELNAGNYHG